MTRHIRLGVNIDHVATVRNARGGNFPDPVDAARLAIKAGADLITAHLREDRRHIRDDDMLRLAEINAPLNMEMAATKEMLEIAIHIKPATVCLVPEKRQEVTTEGGLNLLGQEPELVNYITLLQQEGILVSLFLDPDPEQVSAAKRVNADIIEFHTGSYCNLTGEKQLAEYARIKQACSHAAQLGLKCHAGHGLNYHTAATIAAIPYIDELNIGHFLIGDAIEIGLGAAIKKMKLHINSL
jgi:pyridoxine 5-phosphate synthase